MTTNKLHVEVKDLDSLRFVMTILREIRERESSIEMELTPILDMYQMLEHYLPGGLVDKDEMDQKTIMRPSWRKLVDMAEGIADTLSQIQGQYKKQLILDVREFVAACESTAGSGRRDQTLKFSRSVTSTSIRLMFGRIDRSRRVLEARRKCVCQNCRIRSH